MNSRLSDTDKHVCDLEDIIMKIFPPPPQKVIWKKWNNLRNPWENIKNTNIHSVGISEG